MWTYSSHPASNTAQAMAQAAKRGFLALESLRDSIDNSSKPATNKIPHV
jgi:hypothetical protein